MKHLFKPIYALLALLSLYLVVCGSAMIEWDSTGNLLAHNYGLWGDWSVHFTFVSNLLERGVHWLSGDNPLYSQMPFQYPFLSHLLTAVFAMVFQLGTVTATLWLSLILVFFLPFALFRFYRETGLKDWTALSSAILLLFIGGFQIFDSTLKATDPLTNQPALGSAFTQFFIYEFFPQRAFLFGLIFFCFIATWALKRLKTNTLGPPHALLGALALAASSWLHMHTWIAVGCLLLFFCAFPPRHFNSKTMPSLTRKKALLFGLTTLVLSLFFVGFLLLRKKGMDQAPLWNLWFPGWSQNGAGDPGLAQEMNPLWFWLYNTGFFLPLTITGAVGIFRNREKFACIIPVFAAGMCLFMVALLFKLQPSHYDNLKTFTYAFVFLAPVAALGLEKIHDWIPFKKIALPVVLLLLTLQSSTAIHDLEFMRDHRHTAVFFQKTEFFLAEEFKSLRSSPDALVLITPEHNHWVPCLTGNPVVMGYPGWLWSWGIHYNERERKIQEILAGGPQALVYVDEFKPEYIVIKEGTMAKDHLPINVEFLKSHYSLALQKYGWIVFSTRNSKSPSSSVR